MQPQIFSKAIALAFASALLCSCANDSDHSHEHSGAQRGGDVGAMFGITGVLVGFGVGYAADEIHQAHHEHVVAAGISGTEYLQPGASAKTTSSITSAQPAEQSKPVHAQAKPASSTQYAAKASRKSPATAAIQPKQIKPGQVYTDASGTQYLAQ